MDAIAVTMQELTLIVAYNKAHNHATYVIHTPEGSTIGGFSAEFASVLDSNTVLLKHANGEFFKAPLSRVTVTVQF